MKSKSLLTIAELDRVEIESYLKVAKSFSKKEPKELLKGKTILSLFYENSTRTKTSFDVAARKLGGNVMSLAVSQSSVNKGESLADTVKNLVSLQGDAVVLRSSFSGAGHYLSEKISLPVINAGDGINEHPTQALLDAYTLLERWGDLKGKTVLILGDIANSRVAHSNIQLLGKLGAKVALCGPGTLLPLGVNELGLEVYSSPDQILPKVDAVMVLRVQLERHQLKMVPSLMEYREFWGLTRDRAKLLRPDAYILHPGPINPGIEIDPEVLEEPRSLVLRQTENGVFVRMAVLGLHCNPEGAFQWAQ